MEGGRVVEAEVCSVPVEDYDVGFRFHGFGIDFGNPSNGVLGGGEVVLRGLQG